ncbi:hypothetical protein CERSUDRAFT_78579 [Gelatoporia subvermispora B]|uniref:Uncharacterized protein n=1 Tax=Ceriporiopsis subvermispora (strain B) TaxID=914234 RepID=M2P6E7_CERS8|nr:hypothetical protein CERSUDRAFT_78579 [Gelatoporia subvermispora B]
MMQREHIQLSSVLSQLSCLSHNHDLAQAMFPALPQPTVSSNYEGTTSHDLPLLGIYDPVSPTSSDYFTLTDYNDDGPNPTGPLPSWATYQWLNILPTNFQSSRRFSWIVGEEPMEAEHLLVRGDEFDIVGYTRGVVGNVACFLRGYVIFTIMCRSIQTIGWLAVPRQWALITLEEENLYQERMRDDTLRPPPKPEAAEGHVKGIDGFVTRRRSRAYSFP